jgi:hypothetical protein
MRAAKRKIWQVQALFDDGSQRLVYVSLTKREARRSARSLSRYRDIVHAYVEKMPDYVDVDTEEFWDNFWQITLWVLCGAAAMQLIMLAFGVI